MEKLVNIFSLLSQQSCYNLLLYKNNMDFCGLSPNGLVGGAVMLVLNPVSETEIGFFVFGQISAARGGFGTG